MQLLFLDELLIKRRLHPQKRKKKISQNHENRGSNPRPGVRDESR